MYQQSGNNFSGHGGIEGVELFGSIELNRPGTVEAVEDDIVWIIARLLLGDVCGCRHLWQRSATLLLELETFVLLLREPGMQDSLSWL